MNNMYVLYYKNSGMLVYMPNSRSVFNEQHVEFCGYIIFNKGLSVDPKKIQAITNWPTLKTVHYV